MFFDKNLNVKADRVNDIKNVKQNLFFLLTLNPCPVLDWFSVLAILMPNSPCNVLSYCFLDLDAVGLLLLELASC